MPNVPKAPKASRPTPTWLTEALRADPHGMLASQLGADTAATPMSIARCAPGAFTPSTEAAERWG